MEIKNDKKKLTCLNKLMKSYGNKIQKVYLNFLHGPLPKFIKLSLLLQQSDLIIYFMYNHYLIHWLFYLVDLCHHRLSPSTRIQRPVMMKSEFQLVMKKITWPVFCWVSCQNTSEKIVR